MGLANRRMMMKNELRAHAEAMIEAYRDQTEWSGARNVVLRCLAATWAECSTAERIMHLSTPLCGAGCSLAVVGIQLGKMRKAGLLRKRMIAGRMYYELNLPM